MGSCTKISAELLRMVVKLFKSVVMQLLNGYFTLSLKSLFIHRPGTVHINHSFSVYLVETNINVNMPELAIELVSIGSPGHVAV